METVKPKKVRRNWLLAQVLHGRMECRNAYHYDEMQGQTVGGDWKPARLMITGGGLDYIEGFYGLYASDFATHGHASASADGRSFHLHIHSNSSADLRFAEGAEPAKLTEVSLWSLLYEAKQRVIETESGEDELGRYSCGRKFQAPGYAILHRAEEFLRKGTLYNPGHSTYWYDPQPPIVERYHVTDEVSR